MEISELLLVGIEVSVALAGFAGIIATFQFRDETKIKRGQVVGLSLIVHLSLVLALLCTLPFLLSIFGVPDAILWSVCSGLAALWTAYTQYVVHKNMKGAARTRSTRFFISMLQGVFVLVVISLILNILDLVFHREPGPYIAGIIIGLGLVGIMFTRLLVRPLWKVVREQEARDLGKAVQD